MKIAALSSLLSLQGLACVTAFSIPSSSKSSFIRSRAKSNTAIQACENDEAFTKIFDPLNTQEKYDLDWSNEFRNADRSRNNRSITSSDADTTHALSPLGVSAALVTAATALGPSAANAAKVPLSSGEFNPDNFRPVCPTSDGIYRFAQSTTQSLVGPDNFVEYGPLIAGGLLRVRLELCVVESFFNGMYSSCVIINLTVCLQWYERFWFLVFGCKVPEKRMFRTSVNVGNHLIIMCFSCVFP